MDQEGAQVFANKLLIRQYFIYCKLNFQKNKNPLKSPQICFNKQIKHLKSLRSEAVIKKKQRKFKAIEFGKFYNIFCMLLESGKENRVLDDEENQINLSISQHSLKLDYLVDQKERLEIQMRELRANNRLLRQINKSLDRNNSTNIQAILQRNQQLQKALIKTINQCCQLKTSIFLTNQVCLDNEKQQRQILKNYETKILDLRKLMQAKQLTVQNLEEMIYQKDWDGMSYSRVQLFQRVENINKKLKEFSNKNVHLTTQNERMKAENKKMAEKIQKMQRLTSSKCSYLEYKNLLNQTRVKSTPQSSLHLKSKIQQENIRNRFNPQSTCEYKHTQHKLMNQQSSVTATMEDSNSKSQRNILRNLLKIKCQEIRKLSSKVTNQEEKIARLTEQNRSLTQSNTLYQNFRKSQKEKCHQYQSAFKSLFNLVTQRNPKILQPIISVDNQFKQAYLTKKSANKLKKQSKAVHINSTEDWISIKNSITQRLSNANFKKTKFHKRSYSCILDYIRQPIKNKSAAKLKEPSEQFSMMLQGCNIGQTSIRIGGGKSQKKLSKGKLSQPHSAVMEFLDAFDNIQ